MNYKKLFITLCAVAVTLMVVTLAFVLFPETLIAQHNPDTITLLDGRLMLSGFLISSLCILVALLISDKF